MNGIITIRNIRGAKIALTIKNTRYPVFDPNKKLFARNCLIALIEGLCSLSTDIIAVVKQNTKYISIKCLA